MKTYYRPLAQTDAHRPSGAFPLAGGWCWFDRVEVLSRDAAPYLLAAKDIPDAALVQLTKPRAPVASLDMSVPNVMGILNVTPDSFSDGGLYSEQTDAITQAVRMIEQGADILDIGGESTRPGAQDVAISEEISRVLPAIKAIRARSDIPISIDTRKSEVAKVALAAGADLVNDVAAMSFDPDIARVSHMAHAPICLMHAKGLPENMQAGPTYANVLLEVFDFLEERILVAERAGIPRARIVVDPGIGFGKTLDHNLALLRGLSLFHGLGCPILLGASRKGFIGTITQENTARMRLGGSLAVGLNAYGQGVQILRVHDTNETKQALRMVQAMSE